MYEKCLESTSYEEVFYWGFYNRKIPDIFEGSSSLYLLSVAQKFRNDRIILLKHRKIQSLIGGHLLDKPSDVFAKSSGIPLCFYDCRLERYGCIEMCLVFQIRGVISGCESERIDERKFQGTFFSTITLIAGCSIKSTECTICARERESWLCIENKCSGACCVCKYLTSACLKGFPAGRE